MKKAYVIVGILLVLSVIGIFLIKGCARAVEEGVIVEVIEGEEEVIVITFSFSPNTPPARLITIFDSGRIEIVNGLAETNYANSKDDFIHIGSTRSILINREELEEVIRLSDELMSAQRKDEYEQMIVESRNPTYIRIMYQGKCFETWTIFAYPEMQEFLASQRERRHYDDDTYDLLYQFLIKKQELLNE